MDYGGYPKCATRVVWGCYPAERAGAWSGGVTPQSARARRAADVIRTEVLIPRWTARRPLEPQRGQGSA